MAYPSSIDTPASFGTPAGTSPITSPDHAASHTSLAVALGTVEAVIGTTSGTAIGKNITVGKFAVSDNGGTLSAGVIGTPAISGGTVGTARVIGGTVSAAIIGTSTIQGGTANSLTLGTPTIAGGSIAGSGTVLPISFGVGIAPNAGSFTDSAGGTFDVNAATAQIYYSALGTAAGNRTIGTPLNPTAWQSLTYYIKSSGSANGTLVWPSGAFTFSQDSGTPTLGTSTFWHGFAWRYNPITSRWQYQGQSKNIG